jgi:hypothetical protein
MPGVTQPTPWPEDSLAQDRYGNAVRGMTIGWVCPFGMSMATPVETDNLALSAAAFKKQYAVGLGMCESALLAKATSTRWSTM